MMRILVLGVQDLKTLVFLELQNCRFQISDFEFQISDFRFQNPGARGTGLLRPGEPLGGSRGNPAGRAPAPAL